MASEDSSATPPANTGTYDPVCTDCGFESVVDSGVYAVFDAIEAHRTENVDDSREHTVDFTLRE